MSIANPNIPARTAAVTELVTLVASSLREWADGDQSPSHANLTLAMLEVVFSLPPSWFTVEERMLFVCGVKELYGDPIKFLNDLNDHSVSFYAKYAAANGLPSDGLPLLVMTLKAKHSREVERGK